MGYKNEEITITQNNMNKYHNVEQKKKARLKGVRTLVSFT